jgi:hypothetical protein
LIVAVSRQPSAVSKRARSPSGLDRRVPAEMLLDYLRYVFGGYTGVPDVVGKHEDDRPLLVATSASVAQNGRRRQSQADYLFPEPLKEFATAFGPTPTLSRRGADEDLSRYFHPYILCRVRRMTIEY